MTKSRIYEPAALYATIPPYTDLSDLLNKISDKLTTDAGWVRQGNTFYSPVDSVGRVMGIAITEPTAGTGEITVHQNEISWTPFFSRFNVNGTLGGELCYGPQHCFFVDSANNESFAIFRVDNYPSPENPSALGNWVAAAAVRTQAGALSALGAIFNLLRTYDSRTSGTMDNAIGFFKCYPTGVLNQLTIANDIPMDAAWILASISGTVRTRPFAGRVINLGVLRCSEAAALPQISPGALLSLPIGSETTDIGIFKHMATPASNGPIVLIRIG